MANPWDDGLPAKAMKAFLSASTKRQEAALKHATQFMNTLPYKGRKATENQSLQWPRVGVFRDDGMPVIGVPDEIKKTTGLVAGFILAGIPFDVPAVAWVFHEIGHLLEKQIPLNHADVTWH